MPKIPIISTGSNPAVQAAPRIYGVEPGGAAIAQHGLNTLSGALTDIAASIQEQKADNEITTTDSIYKARLKVLKEQVFSDPDIENYTQEFLNREKEIYAESAAGLTMASTKRAFEKIRGKTLPAETADMAVGELKLSAVREGANVKRAIDLRTGEASLAETSADRAAIDLEVSTMLERSVGRKFMTADVAETIQKRHNERVDMAWATRRANTDPIGTAEDLQAGAYKGIPQDRAENFARILMDRAQRKQDQERVRSEHEQTIFNRWFNDQKAQKETDLTIQAGDGTLSLDQLKQDAKDWQIHPERYQAIKNILDKPSKKEKSDEDTLTAVSIDSNSGNPKISLSQLAAMREAGLLNQADFDRESQKRLVLQRQDASEARILASQGRATAATERTVRNQEYVRAAELLRASLGIPGIIENLDPVTKKLYSAALAELQNRSNSVQGVERAPEVVRDIITRYVPQLDTQAMMDAKQIQGTIRFKTTDELEANRDKISLPEYENNKNALIRLNELRKQAEARAAAKAAEAPKPGGIFDWFLPAPKPNQPGAAERKPK
jgi:hypothetical protein